MYISCDYISDLRSLVIHFTFSNLITHGDTYFSFLLYLITRDIPSPFPVLMIYILHYNSLMLQDPQLFCFMANMKNFAHSKCFNLPFLSVLGDRLPPFGVHYFICQSLKNQFQSEPSAEKSPQVKSIDIFHPPVDLTNPTRGLFPFHLCCIRSE